MTVLYIYIAVMNNFLSIFNQFCQMSLSRAIMDFRDHQLSFLNKMDIVREKSGIQSGAQSGTHYQ